MTKDQILAQNEAMINAEHDRILDNLVLPLHVDQIESIKDGFEMNDFKLLKEVRVSLNRQLATHKRKDLRKHAQAQAESVRRLD